MPQTPAYSLISYGSVTIDLHPLCQEQNEGYLYILFSLEMVSGNKNCLISCLNAAPKFLAFSKGTVASVCNYNTLKVSEGVHLKLGTFLILATDGGGRSASLPWLLCCFVRSSPLFIE